ncbi:MAG: phage major tail protein, TP901-1 family [Kordiimonas sp.]
MAAQKGRELLIQIHDGSGDFNDENYVVVGGFDNNGITMNGEAVEITNKDSQGFKEYLEAAGNVSISLTGGGVFVDDESFRRVHEHMVNQTHPQCRVIVPEFARYTGSFSITSLSVTGNNGAAVTYEIALDSAGVIAIDYI